MTKTHAWLLAGFIPDLSEVLKNTDKAWNNAAVTGLSQLRYYDIFDLSLECDCAVGFLSKCYPLLATLLAKCIVDSGSIWELSDQNLRVVKFQSLLD